MTAWADVLKGLHTGIADAGEDIWYYLTAAGMTERSLSEAEEAADILVSYVPNLQQSRVADLGCGVGRHLVSLAKHTGELVGIESSAKLAGLASRFAPGAQVVVGSMHDLAELGAFDVVCAFSHILMLTDGPEGVVANLQLLRGAMPDYGLLVAEVMHVLPGTLKWPGPYGSTVVERRQPTPTGLIHEFSVKSTAGEWAKEFPSARVDPSAWPVLAEAGGFQVEKVKPFLYSDGTSSTFYFLRAQKGYNLLSDLREFIESWAQPDHPRNRRAVEWATADSYARRRPMGTLALGQGSSLSKHHPEFADALEARIRPLVLEFAQQWHFVTYSSCGGHLIRGGPAEVYSDAYCGLVTFSNRQLSTITRLVAAATRDLDSAEVAVEVRARTLHGTGTALTAADVLFKRAGADVPWRDYENEVGRAVVLMSRTLRELRERT